MLTKIKEGKASIFAYNNQKISKEMDVFYNPVMKLNRDISILLIKSCGRNNLNICDLLAGTGIRSIRFLLEINKNKINEIVINDANKKAIDLIKKNLRLNKLKKKVNITNKDANKLLLESYGFDYIEIDPFGSPNPFLDSAIKRISREGILAVTATDVSALSGTYKNACLRKYGSRPLRNYLMHEIGLRILIRKVQLIGNQYDKALFPIFSHSSDHYLRVYLYCEKSKTKVDEIIKQHKYFLYCNNCFNTKTSDVNIEKCNCDNNLVFSGPIWIGKLWNESLVNKMLKNCKDSETIRLLEIINQESKINLVGFYDIISICEKLKISPPKKNEIIKKIKSKGYKATITHFNHQGIKSNITSKEIIKIVKNSK